MGQYGEGVFAGQWCFLKNANFFATFLRSTVFRILKGEGPLKFEKNK
jgi:hypothetical protein